MILFVRKLIAKALELDLLEDSYIENKNKVHRGLVFTMLATCHRDNIIKGMLHLPGI